MTDPLTLARDPRTPPEQLWQLARRPDEAMRLALAANPSSPRELIETLLGKGRLSGSGPLAEVAEAVLGNASLPLWLLDDPGWMAKLMPLDAFELARSPALTPLAWEALREHPAKRVRLALVRSPVAPPGAWSLLRLSRGTTWDLSQEGLRTSDLAALLACARSDQANPIDRVETMRLTRNSLGDEDLAALAHDGPLPALTELLVSQNLVRDRGLMALGRSRCLPRLQTLDLSLNRLKSRGLVDLARSTTLPRLSALLLSANQVGPAGVQALAASASFPALRHLDLSGNPVGDEGARALLRAPWFASLGRLYLQRCGIGETLRRELREAAAQVPGLSLAV